MKRAIPLLTWFGVLWPVNLSIVHAEPNGTHVAVLPAPAPTIAPGTIVVQQESCVAQCRQRHNQCRIATRGANHCDIELQRCLQGCLSTRKR